MSRPPVPAFLSRKLRDLNCSALDSGQPGLLQRRPMPFLSILSSQPRGSWGPLYHLGNTNRRVPRVRAGILKLICGPQMKPVEMLTSPSTAPRLLLEVQPSRKPMLPSQAPPELESTRLISFHLSYLFNRKFAV